MTFVKNAKGEWWELDREKMNVWCFCGGWHNITEKELQESEVREYKDWHELTAKTGWCSLEVTPHWPNIWISPEGKCYDGEAHENRAEELLELLYGETDVMWPGDRIQKLGWVRASGGLMWGVRIRDGYWDDKHLTQAQYDALWDWCQCHGQEFPQIEAEKDR